MLSYLIASELVFFGIWVLHGAVIRFGGPLSLPDWLVPVLLFVIPPVWIPYEIYFKFDECLAGTPVTSCGPPILELLILLVSWWVVLFVGQKFRQYGRTEPPPNSN